MPSINIEDLKNCLADNKTIFQVMEQLTCSRNTIINMMKKYKIKTPKGFFATGKKIGRPKGTPQPQQAVEEMKARVSGKNNPFYGKKHSKNTRKKMSENHADFSGEKNPYKNFLEQNPSERLKASERTKKQWKELDEEQYSERCRKISFAMSNSDYHKNNSSLKSHDSGHLKTKKGGTIFHRSSWEKLFAIFLDQDPSVSHFSCEPFCLKYQNNNGNVRYTRPDFLIHTETSVYLVEIKPEGLLKHRNNQQKIQAMKEYAKKHKIYFLLVTDTHIEQIKKREIHVIEEIN